MFPLRYTLKFCTLYYPNTPSQNIHVPSASLVVYIRNVYYSIPSVVFLYQYMNIVLQLKWLLLRMHIVNLVQHLQTQVDRRSNTHTQIRLHRVSPISSIAIITLNKQKPNILLSLAQYRASKRNIYNTIIT